MKMKFEIKSRIYDKPLILVVFMSLEVQNQMVYHTQNLWAFVLHKQAYLRGDLNVYVIGEIFIHEPWQ